MFFNGETICWEYVDEKIERQIMGFDNALMLVLVRFKKGGVGRLHQHFHSQATYIAQGTFEITIANQTKQLKKGDSFFIPSNTPHAVVCTDDGILVDAFSPMREDFRNKIN